jgi:WD40 repeat protein
MVRLVWVVWPLLSTLLCAAARAAPPVTAASFAPRGDAVAVGSQLGIQVLSWPGLEEQGRFATRLTNVHDLAFSPTGDRLAAVGGRPGESGEIEIFSWPSGEPLVLERIADDLFYAVAWSNDASRLAVAGAESLVVEIDAEGGVLRRAAGHSGPVFDLAWSPDGAALISGSRDNTLRTWKSSTLEPARTLSQHAGAVHALAVRPLREGPPWVASSGADRTVRFWQPTIGRQVRFARLPSEALAIDWSPGGDLLLAACADGRLRAIDPATVEIVGDWPAIDGWAYVALAHPGGERALIAGEGGQIKIVDYRIRSVEREAP